MCYLQLKKARGFRAFSVVLWGCVSGGYLPAALRMKSFMPPVPAAGACVPLPAGGRSLGEQLRVVLLHPVDVDPSPGVNEPIKSGHLVGQPQVADAGVVGLLVEVGLDVGFGQVVRQLGQLPLGVAALVCLPGQLADLLLHLLAAPPLGVQGPLKALHVVLEEAADSLVLPLQVLLK
jgi:hypothetical protein